jgi:protease-4
MTTKKHPILKGLIGLGVALFLFFFLAGLFSSFLGKESNLSLGEKIGVVPITGIITDSLEVLEQLQEFKKNTKIKAIVIRIDSPGGGVGPSQEIYEEIKKVRKEKKVVASIGSLGASGGYYIACACDTIVANSGAITGSIGVIVEYANFAELLGKIGLKGVVLKSGKYKDSMSPIREMTEEEKSIIQAVVDDIHRQFLSAVVTSRHLNKDQEESIADARIFTGSQAKNLGLVDELGNFSDAVNIAAKMGGIKGEPELIYPKKKKSFFDYFVGESFSKWQEALYFPYRFSYMSSLNR